MKNNEKAFMIILGVLVLCLVVGGGILIWQNNERIKTLENDLNNSTSGSKDNDADNNNNNSSKDIIQTDTLKINDALLGDIGLTDSVLQNKYGSIVSVKDGNTVNKKYSNSNITFMFQHDFSKKEHPPVDDCSGIECELKDFILNIKEDNITIGKIRWLFPDLKVEPSAIYDFVDVCMAKYKGLEVVIEIQQNLNPIPTDTIVEIYKQQ